MTTPPVDFPNPEGADPETGIPFPDNPNSEEILEMGEHLAHGGGAPPQFEYMGFQQPLFDAEYVGPENRDDCVRFYQRQLGQFFGAKNTVIKGNEDTNLCQAGCLSTPLVFFLKGFCVDFPDDITPDEKRILLHRANFEFSLRNRILLRVPLRHIVENKSLRALRRADGQALPSVAIQTRPSQPVDFPVPAFASADEVGIADFNEIPLVEEDIYDRCYRIFPNPTQRLRIDSQENFQAQIRWAVIPELTRWLRLECLMVGTLLTPR